MTTLYQGDCLVEMDKIPDSSVNMVLADIPCGITAYYWDSVIPLEPMWKHLNRVIRKNGAVVLTASQPFTSILICSNLKMFKYEIIWEKDSPTNPFMAKIQIMKRHENICVFYEKQPTFNPQMEKRKDDNNDFIYPNSIQKFTRRKRCLHPTQKPVALMEYLIKTYTNEGETVLDFTMGSGTAGVACKNLKRDFIGIELDKGYFDIAEKWINDTQEPLFVEG